jgi:hypothetical protein
MKNINKILIAFIAVLVVSCTADAVDTRTVLVSISTPEVLTPENNVAFVLTEANAANVADRFTWTKAKYSNDVVVQYTLLMDIKGGDFTSAKTIGTTSDINQLTVLVRNLNQIAIELGAVPGEATLFDLKVKSSVSGAVVMVSKTPITISINAYSGLVTYDFTDWYLIGGAVEGDWDNEPDTKHQPMFRSGTAANKYSFTGYFKAGNFKLISTKGSWAAQLGRSSTTAIELNGNAGEFTIATAGYYKFTFDTTALTYTLVAYDASAAAMQNRLGYLGSSRTGTDAGWNGDDSEMTVSAFSPHVWTLNISLFDGKGKFRANNAWDKNWGGDTEFSGFTGNGASGGDIPVAKSKYKIYFNDLDGSYLMIPNQE